MESYHSFYRPGIASKHQFIIKQSYFMIFRCSVCFYLDFLLLDAVLLCWCRVFIFAHNTCVNQLIYSAIYW